TWIKLDTHPESSDFSHKVKDIDRIIKTMMGRHTLPSLPFIVLSILTAIQHSQELVPENGSFGFLYEVLITTALKATHSDNAQIEKKYTFLALLSFHLFETGSTTIDSSGIHGILDRYARSYRIKLDKSTILLDLTTARILIEEDGLYSFTYSHYFYYFLARYFKSHLDGEDGPKLRDRLKTLAKSLPAEFNSIF